MPAPKVQTIEQIVNDLNPAYQGSIDMVNKRKALIPEQQKADQMALDAQKTKNFNKINENMAARGISGGLPSHEQAEYLSDVYLPGMQRLKSKAMEQEMGLDEALAQINKERRLAAMDTRTRQQSSLQKYLAEERQMAWDREKFKAQQAMEQKRMAAQGGGSTADPADTFKSFIAGKFKAAGKNPSRQTQDAWAREFFVKYGVDRSKRQDFWDLYNDTYKRTNDPTEDWLYKR